MAVSLKSEAYTFSEYHVECAGPNWARVVSSRQEVGKLGRQCSSEGGTFYIEMIATGPGK